ncbi:hypothetical protein JJE68_01234 [Pediococcus acidilactici]|uniref:hypothetical protein n=1 Tax=Pediococcus acidilactici TaxID=1254 RepID=UPI000465801F|nr:hypothetical protein [Pediococcus acidilactici]QZQ47760.1 hypothetical protein JJE68_01234 [Pediococcus acidilactici]
MDKGYGVKLAYYESLLENSYAEAVAKLKEKYGTVEDDYFREKSYERFLNGKIKFPEKGNFSKTALGLYCHHVNENHHEHLADLEWIKKYQYSFELQQKEQLVYCDLFEHLLLQALIMKETGNQFGETEFRVVLAPDVINFYSRKLEPKTKWKKVIKQRAFLPSEETEQLLDKVMGFLGTV